MELHKIEKLLERYFEGETSIVEESELQSYFSSPDVAQHLEQYKPLFGYFSAAKQESFKQQIAPLPSEDNKRRSAWLSVAASVVVLLGAGTFAYFSQTSQTEDLGTYDDPEIALRETQKALSLLSAQVNKGVKSVQYIEQYDEAKDRVFTN
ncbi:MAG TPA: SipW-dependent-type signal peptide-containing protein [Flavobacterium sp.]|jgi:predicted ribosomally synthesized peptide with SipW-like signal peptide